MTLVDKLIITIVVQIITAIIAEILVVGISQGIMVSPLAIKAKVMCTVIGRGSSPPFSPDRGAPDSDGYSTANEATGHGH